MSNVYWAFKNNRSEFNTITFEGPVIKCLDLKRAILQKTRSQGKEVGELNYGLVLCNAQTGEEYRNDIQQIHRNTSVIVKRVPVNQSEMKKLTVAPATKILPSIDAITGGDKDDPFGPTIYGKGSASKEDLEKSKLFAIMKEHEPEKWNQKDKWKKGTWHKSGSKPPANYTCFSCNTPGHWIWDCPNKGKKTTVPVDNQVMVENPATTLLEKALKKKHGLLDGPKQSARDNTLLAPYCCSLCKNMFRKPTLTPCCKQSFCDECIRQYLIVDDKYTCPSCDERISPDDLAINEALQRKLSAIKEKFADPNVTPTHEELEQIFPARDFRKNRHRELPTVDSGSIACLECGMKGHMFKDCPNKGKQIIQSSNSAENDSTKENRINMQDPPNLLTNPAPLAPNPLANNLPNQLMGLQMNGFPALGMPAMNPAVMGGGTFGEMQIPSLMAFMQMQKLSKQKRERSRTRSRDRRRRRKRRRRSRSRSSSRGRRRKRSRRSRRDY